MHPRWEDFKYEPADPTTNRFYWLGDGQTHAEKTLTGDSGSNFRFSLGTHSFMSCTRDAGAWYLSDEFPDIPPGEQRHSFELFAE